MYLKQSIDQAAAEQDFERQKISAKPRTSVAA